jgi:predicted nucleic acid-binding protein
VKAAVVDASVALKWVVDEEFSEQASALLTGTTLCAPAHWQAEAVNAIWGQVYRSKLSAEDARQRVSTLINAPVEPVPLATLLDQAFGLSVALRLTVYDSLYVALAKARGIPLVSDNRRLLLQMMSDPTLAALAHPLADLA